jgi:hypothetical protein
MAKKPIADSSKLPKPCPHCQGTTVCGNCAGHCTIGLVVCDDCGGDGTCSHCTKGRVWD